VSAQAWRGRLAGLPTVALAGGLRVHVAATPWARLRGLAGLPALPPDRGLLLPATRAVHTLGMRVALDLLWLDGAGGVVRVDPGVVPRRHRGCRRAAGVLEVRAGSAEPFAAALPDAKLVVLTDTHRRFERALS
jgi:uncharacterized membrane protein (UPF0127 family)